MDQNEPSYWAINPLDGRYQKTTSQLKNYLSEGALVSYRIKIELLWTVHLLESMKKNYLPSLIEDLDTSLETVKKLSLKNYHHAISAVKKIEAVTNHDVKACEYYIQKLFDDQKLNPKLKSIIHFACTSEDINNLSYGLMLRDLRQNTLLPIADEIEKILLQLVETNKDIPLLARTHGQAASPTTLGKELAVFLYRMGQQKKELVSLKILGKINGAVGNYNAHHFVFPETNWPKICQSFVEEKLGLSWNPYTTQIESHDYLAKICHNISLSSSISIGLCQDIWSYISSHIFGQRTVKGEVGSSTMPHKVNPIDFENAEGNFGVARNLANHLADKLPISRRQRDLSDSTVQRSCGTLFGHYYLAQKSLLKGLSKIEARKDVIERELEDHWEVLAEPIQMLLRRHGVTNAYEKLKNYSRGKALTKEDIKIFIQELEEIPETEKNRLLDLTPSKYTGLASSLCEAVIGTLKSNNL